MGISIFTTLSLRLMNMNKKTIRLGTAAWLVLMLLTISGWILFEKIATLNGYYILSIISFIKILLIGFFFMEINKAKKLFYRFYLCWAISITLLFMGSVYFR